MTLKVKNENYLSSTIDQINMKASYADYIVGYASPKRVFVPSMSTVTVRYVAIRWMDIV